jgi:PAS domain S-box-containing protein
VKKRPSSGKTKAGPRPAAGRENGSAPGRWISETEFAHLNERLREAHETIDAIQSGTVDAVVVKGTNGSQIYSLAGAEQRYRVYVEQMQEGAITASKAGVILYCNQRFALMVKMPLERVIGSGILNYFVTEAWSNISTVFTEQREVVKHEDVLQSPSGTTLAVHLTASRMPALEEDIICVVVTDLTEQKDRQELRLARDVAEKANLAKDAFLAALSHELRTPLTPVLMAVVALEETPGLPDYLRKDLTMIRRNVELEARLIDDLLDLTRIAKGKLELRLEPMDLHVVIGRAVEICRSDLAAGRQHFEFHLEAVETVTMGDAVRLEQALWNLIRNAIKFTPAGGRVTIRTGNDARRNVWVEVRDTGIGFDPKDSHKLFDAFEQGGRHITRQFGGLGLGLAIGSAILVAHGGTIRAESPGHNLGATFTLALPLSLPVAIPAALAPPVALVAKKTRHLRILLVEDHKDTRKVLQLYLLAAKNEVTAAENAQQALEFAASQEFDVVVSDLGLPDEGGGFAMMRRLRDRHGLKGIAVSGYGMEEDVARSHAAGFSHHLTKPLNLGKLTALIAEVSDQSWSNRETVQAAQTLAREFSASPVNGK